jgi:fructokinase
MFYVCGEALYDVFLAGETANGFTLDARIGGSAFNAAMGLARLGRPVALVTGVSTDPLGERLVREMAAEGVETRRLARKAEPTTLALVGLRPDGSARYSFYGAGAADRAVTPADLPRLTPEVRGVLFGCFSLLTEPTGSSFLALARAAKGGPLVSLDPNVRATVEPDMGRWRARVEAFAAHADLVKVSDEDMAALYPGAAPADIARRWLCGGASAVVMTRGADGATAWLPGAIVEAAAPPVSVVDTVGAGDTFLAAFLTALDEAGLTRRPAFEALSDAACAAALGFAAEAAALTCARRGADLPRRAELPPAPMAGLA